MNTTFYMIYLEGGNTPTVKHTDYESALKEAKRLVQETQKEAYILQAKQKVSLDIFKITDLQEKNTPSCQKPDEKDLPF